LTRGNIRDFEAVDRKQKVDLAKSGVDEPGSSSRSSQNEAELTVQAGKAKTGRGNNRRMGFKTRNDGGE
jgi:hypothetical protein